MEKGQCDLKAVIKESNGPLDFKRFFPIFRDCIYGLSYIHSKNIAHRDIKPANILKFNEYSYKLADYGEG
jgi:serine/threonine protein kinase